MRKHAILIFSHSSLKELVSIVEYFDDNFDIFIHFDKKSRINKKELNKFLLAYPHIKFYRFFKLRWGGIPIVKAELKLLSIILNTGNYSYIHIISESDRPIKSLSEFKNFFLHNQGSEYVGCFPLPDHRWENGSLKRFELFQFNDWFDYRTKFGKMIIDILNEVQNKFNLKRNTASFNIQLYGGSTWMSITNECAFYIISNQEKFRHLFNRLRFSFGADEVYLQTVIMNSPFANKVTFDDCRYTKWHQGSPSPCWLTLKDCFDISTSQKVFARKFHPKLSASLWNWIEHYLINKTNPQIGQNGEWLTDNFSGHIYDNGLEFCLTEIVKDRKIKTAVDMGCGPGWYVAFLRRIGIKAHGYDANPNTAKLSSNMFSSDYHCECLDLSKRVWFNRPFNFVLSIEVGEHISKKFQYIFLDNLTNNCSDCLLLSWAIPGQIGDGHVNPRSNEWVINQLYNRGLIFNREKTILYRSKCSYEWLKKTLMFFERFPTGRKHYCCGKSRY